MKARRHITRLLFLNGKKIFLLTLVVAWGLLLLYSGAWAWQRNINGNTTDPFSNNDQALAVTVDGAGNVVTVGITQNAGTIRDFTVVKLNGADGSDF